MNPKRTIVNFILAAGLAACSPFSDDASGPSGPTGKDPALKFGGKLIIRDASRGTLAVRILGYDRGRLQTIFAFDRRDGALPATATVERESLAYSGGGALAYSLRVKRLAADPERTSRRETTYDTTLSDTLPIHESTLETFPKHADVKTETDFTASRGADPQTIGISAHLVFPGCDTTFLQRSRSRVSDTREEIIGTDLRPKEGSDPLTLALEGSGLYEVHSYAEGRLVKKYTSVGTPGLLVQTTEEYVYANGRVDSTFLVFALGDRFGGKWEFRDLDVKTEIRKEFAGTGLDLTDF